MLSSRANWIACETRAARCREETALCACGALATALCACGALTVLGGARCSSERSAATAPGGEVCVACEPVGVTVVFTVVFTAATSVRAMTEPEGVFDGSRASSDGSFTPPSFTPPCWIRTRGLLGVALNASTTDV
jgi:hypothetical protein